MSYAKLQRLCITTRLSVHFSSHNFIFGVVQWGERTILSHYNVTVFHLPPSANIGQYFDYLTHTGGHCPQIHPSASVRQPLIASNIADV